MGIVKKYHVSSLLPSYENPLIIIGNQQGEYFTEVRGTKSEEVVLLFIA